MSNNLKHLLLFESFSSKAISRSISFLRNSIGKKESERFINTLRKIKDIYDYPIDKLSDAHLDYMSAKDALKIRAPKDFESTNRWDLYCLTFWFSVESGYLGYTGTGGYSEEYREGVGKNRPFTERELSTIKDKLQITKGKLIPVNDYTKLNHLDKVIGYFSSTRDTDALCLATMWIRRGSMWAIQDSVSGDSPNNRDEWEQYGRYGWSMGEVSYPGSDHLSLHLYVESDEDLHVADESELRNEPRDYILPVRSNGRLSSWSGSYNSCNSSSIIEDSDFAIVLYIDDLMNPDKAEYYEYPSDIKSFRKSSKEGATKLLSDEDIRQQNIERYMSKMLQSYGITKSSVDISDVRSVVLKGLNPNALISCRRGHVSDVSRFSDRLYRMMRFISEGYSKEDIENEYSNLIEVMQNIHNKSIGRSKNYKESMKVVRDYFESIIADTGASERQVTESTRAINILNIVENIGKKIYDNISSQKISTLEDLKIIYYKLSSIRNTIEEDRYFYLSDHISNAFAYLESGKGYARNSENYLLDAVSSNVRYEDNLKILTRIEKMIDSYFK